MFFDKKSELLDKAISVAEDWKETCEKYQALLNKTLNDLKEAQEKVIRLTEQNNKLVLEVAMFRKKEGD